jgi:cell division protein FtsI (penicillin-binding protein 3)
MQPAWGKKEASKAKECFHRRAQFLIGVLAVLLLLTTARLVQLHIFHKNFLRAQGNARSVHIVKTPSYRGMLLDRRHEPLAVSTPVDAAWIDPRRFDENSPQLGALAQLLQLKQADIIEKKRLYPDKAFIYLKRWLTPDIGEQIKNLRIKGVYTQREYRRYYPSGQDAAQLIGFTDIDDNGQAGLELFYDEILRPIPGKKRVLEDRIGHWLEDIENIQVARSGQNITLSIDARIQSLILKVLQETLTSTGAKSASAIMVDVTTGEILGMASAPSFNPNVRQERLSAGVRLRTLTDPIEPGSTIKPFTMCSILEKSQFTVTDIIDTNPGTFKLGAHQIKDVRNYGRLTVPQVLTKSSNIGISKMVLTMSPDDILETFDQFGLGSAPILGLPGENSGQLDYQSNDATFHASYGYGYGFTVTPIQLVSAYATLANKGKQKPLSILKLDRKNIPQGRSIIDASVAEEVLKMLGEVTEGGTGRRAAISGYLSGGKTGTSRVVGPTGYDDSRHLSLFAGITPLQNPKLATVIIVEEPQEGGYYGGLVAAPVYAKVVSGALQMLNLPPDKQE